MRVEEHSCAGCHREFIGVEYVLDKGDKLYHRKCWRREKLDEIIKNLQNAYDNLMEDEYGYSPKLSDIIDKLEKFKEEEL